MKLRFKSLSKESPLLKNKCCGKLGSKSNNNNYNTRVLNRAMKSYMLHLSLRLSKPHKQYNPRPLFKCLKSVRITGQLQSLRMKLK
jgi:hypothetical protein